MPLDPNIIMQAQLPQLQNPLDAMTKAMTFRNLANTNQMDSLKAQTAQQDFNDQSAMRQAYANNTKVDPNGNATVNQSGFMSDLANKAPHLLPQAQQNFAAMDVAKAKAALEHVSIGAQTLAGVTDQASYDQARQKAISMGGDVSQWPPGFDPGVVQRMQLKAVDVGKQLELGIKQQEQQNKAQELKNQTAELGLKITKDKATQVQETGAALQSARGNPSVQQAERDMLSSDKFNKLLEGRDLNKLSPTEVGLAYHELLKAASGGQGTEEELASLKPNTPGFKLAQIAQNFKNAPSPAEAGKFLSQARDYMNGISDVGWNTVKNNNQRILNTKSPYLPASDAKNFRDNYLNKDGYIQTIGQSENQNTGVASQHPQANAALDWAKANPKDPRSAKIMQRLGK